MSTNKSEWMPVREKPSGRWQIIREVQIPTEQCVITGKDGKEREVSPAIVKSVLLDLAQWDSPGAQVFKGVQNIHHATGLPPASINRAMRVLRDMGILMRKPRGLGKSKLSVLDWDLLDTLRVPFRSERQDSQSDNVEELEATTSTAAAAPAVEVSCSPIATAVLALAGVADRLPKRDAEWLAGVLQDSYGEDGAILALRWLSEDQLKTALANAKDLPRYLRKLIDDAHAQLLAQLHGALEKVNAGECQELTMLPVDVSARARAIRVLRDVAGGDFDIGEPDFDGRTWFVTIAPRLQSSIA